MAKSIRLEKVSAEIQRVLSQILQFGVRDLRVQDHFGSITRVELTGDMKHAKIFISVFGSEAEQKDFMEGLASARGFIRSEMAAQLRLRAVPELHFKLDKSFEEGARVLSILDELKARGDLDA
ncbi:MAG: 30S ribosome-binding factor RbfA [Candidatus Sericytochromatia bacterium]|nr:30S ribosome-binding factor RbfA [Candidatus Sericytochromatia bacterium]